MTNTNTNEKYTKRMLYTAIVNGEELTDELVEVAAKALAALDKGNEKARQRAADKRAEKKPHYEALFNALTNIPQTASDLLAVTGLAETLKPQSVSAAMRGYVADGLVVKTNVKVDKKTAVAYRLATEDETAEAAEETDAE